MKERRKLTHATAARPPFEELTGETPKLAGAEPSIATHDPEPGQLAQARAFAPKYRQRDEEEAADPWVPLTVQVRRSTYMRLAQAKHWTPGFGELRKQVDRALNTHLDSNKYSNQTLPPEELRNVLNTTRLGGK